MQENTKLVIKVKPEYNVEKVAQNLQSVGFSVESCSPEHLTINGEIYFTKSSLLSGMEGVDYATQVEDFGDAQAKVFVKSPAEEVEMVESQVWPVVASIPEVIVVEESEMRESVVNNPPEPEIVITPNESESTEEQKPAHLDPQYWV